MIKLSGDELVKLIQSVFPYFDGDKKLGILVDIPSQAGKDNIQWKQRRLIAQGWFEELKNRPNDLNLVEIALIAYEDVGTNNGDLPKEAFFINGNLPDEAEMLKKAGKNVLFETIFQQFQIFLAPTEYSTTAPLKNAAKTHLFRAATMPGFSPEMIPALRIDYSEVFRRLMIIKQKVDAATQADVVFFVDNTHEYNMSFDLRFRESHVSSGRFPEKATAGNLPSGETYIVPYEGEKGEKSNTHGILPVQIENDVILFTIIENRVSDVSGDSPNAQKEREHVRKEPAYGNMAELGFGVLGDFGLNPINEILLDEKLGFHVAFGRSDHFGGAVGPKDFSSPQEVIHLDRIYIPATQPRIIVKSLIFQYEDQHREMIMENGQYLVF